MPETGFTDSKCAIRHSTPSLKRKKSDVKPENILKNSHWIFSYGSSILVDIEQIVSTEFINDLFTFTLARMDEPADTIAEQIVTLSDYLYIRATSPTSGEIVWVFDNKNVNALRQISDIVMPYIKLFVASQM